MSLVAWSIRWMIFLVIIAYSFIVVRWIVTEPSTAAHASQSSINGGLNPNVLGKTKHCRMDDGHVCRYEEIQR